MIESLVAPILRQRGKGARDLAARTAGDLAGEVLRLHGALVAGALAEAGLAEAGLANSSPAASPSAAPSPVGTGRADAARLGRGVAGASA
jgi:hypothetical protein